MSRFRKNTPRRHKQISRSEYRKNIRELTGEKRRNMRWQVLFILLPLFILIVRVIYLFFNIAIVDNKKYTEIAAHTHTEQYKEYPRRGNIYSVNGTEIAVSTYTYNVGVSPKVFNPGRRSEYTKEDIIKGIAGILELDSEKFADLLAEYKDSAYFVLKNNVTPEVNDILKAYIEEARVVGIRQDANPARYYPLKDFASSLIGFANKQDQELSGISGVELKYNRLLSGTPSYVYQEVDNYWAQALPGTLQASIEAGKSYNLRLTIMEDLQLYIQEMMDYLYGATDPLSGAQILVMDTKTGGILAYTNNLTFDLNNPYSAPATIDSETWDPFNNEEQMDFITGTVWSNQSIRTPFEVGSVIKPFVLAMGLEENVIDSTSYLSDDPVTMDGWTMSSYDNRSRGMLSLAESIWDSRNPPFIRISERLGINRFYEYIDALSMKTLTGIDLPNETVGLFHQNPNRLDMAVTSFGEQVTMTFMQVAADYVALANDGMLLTPHVADAVIDDKGNAIEEYVTEQRRQIFSKETMQAVRKTMIGVGRYGSAMPAYVPGFEVAFKTGTSSRAINGATIDNTFTHTAIGILPADEPRYLVMASSHDYDKGGSYIAHVIAREILEFLTVRDNMIPNMKAYDYNTLFKKSYTASAVGETAREVAHRIAYRGALLAKDKSLAWDGIVRSQYPYAGLLVPHDHKLWVSAVEGALPENYVQIPDFSGLTALEAKTLAKKLNLNVVLNGSNRAGVITSQEVIRPELAGGAEIGENIREYSQIVLNFEGYDKPGPVYDDSIVAGYNDGNGDLYGW